MFMVYSCGMTTTDKQLPYDITHAVKADKFDVQNFEEVSAGEYFPSLANRGAKKVNHNFPHLIEDVFQSLFQYKPVASAINEHTERNAKLLKSLQDQQEFQSMRELTKLDEFQSALATAKFVETLLAQADQDQNLEDMLKQEQPKDQKAAEQQEAAFRNAVRMAMGEAQAEIEDTQEVMSALGIKAGKLAEKLGEGSFDDRKAAIEQMRSSKSLLEIAKRVGKLHRIMQSAKMTKSKHGREEIVGITQSNDVSRMTPRELMMMRKARPDWNRRYVNRTLATYEMQGKQPMGKGPVCICLDKSSSMSGENDQWSTAIMFAVLLEAQKDKRDAYICMFNGGIMHEETLIAGKYSIQDLMRLASKYPSGGTNFTVALEGSLKAIQADKRLKQADIVFVTDGEDNGWKNSDFATRFNAEREKRDIRMFTILIGSDTSSLKEISDEIHPIQSLVETTAGESVHRMVDTTNV
jgi:uncharacterized protein with von Willebrand factor type A (vWA) domain